MFHRHSMAHPLAACAAAACLCIAASPAAAQAFSFDLSAQPLASAITQFGQVAGLTMMAPQELLAGRRIVALKGVYTPVAGLTLLLRGTGLSAELRGNVVTLRLAPAVAAKPAEGAAAAGAEATASARVEIVGRREARPGEGHTTVNTLSRRELDRFAVTSTSDAFRDLPGVSTVSGRNGASFDLNIRGLQGDRIKVLVDGTQSTSNTSKSYGGDGSHNYVDPDLLGSITVEKGPNARPEGAGTGGGVVSMETLRADDLITTVGQPWGARLRLGGGSNAGKGKDYLSYDNKPLTVSTPEENVAASVAGAWRGWDNKLELVGAFSARRTGNYHAGERGPRQFLSYTMNGLDTYADVSLYKPGAEVFNTSQETRSTLLKARLALPVAQWAEVIYSALDSEFGESRVTSYAYNIEQKKLSGVDKKNLTLRYGWQPRDNPWWNLRVNLWQVKVEESHAELNAMYETKMDAGRGKSRGVEAWNGSRFDWRGHTLDLRYGGSWAQEETAGYTPNEPTGEREIGSAFVNAEMRLFGWLGVDAGLRQETYTLRGTDSYPSKIPGQTRVRFQIDDGQERLNGHLALSVMATEGSRFYLRYAEGWRPPTPKETVRTYNASQQTLRAELTRSLEAGLQLQASPGLLRDDKLQIKAAVFSNTHADYISRALANEGYSYFNIAGARFAGYELSLRYAAEPFFANYTMNHYVRTEFCGFQKPGCTDDIDVSFGPTMWGLAMPPRTTQSITLGTRWFDQRLTLGLRANIVGRPTGLNRDSGQTVTFVDQGWSDYEVHDFFASLRLGSNFELNFSVENLQNLYYREAGNVPALTIPAPGRTGKVALTYTF